MLCKALPRSSPAICACWARNLSSAGPRSKYLAYPVFLRRLQIQVSEGSAPRGIKMSSRMTLSSVEEYYNDEDKENILRIVNETSSPEDFSRYVISKKKIEELVKLKTSTGFIKSVEELVSIIGLKGSSKFFCSLLDRPTTSVSNPMYPIPTVEEVLKTSTILSVNISGSAVAWCKMRRRDNDKLLVVEELGQKSFNFKPKSHFLSVLNEIREIVNQLPKAQVCIIDEYPNSQPNPYMFAFQLQMTQMRSFLLGNILSSADPPTIYSIKSIAVGKMFNTLIGSERVSAQHVVDNIIIWKPVPSLIIPASAKSQYVESESKDKEAMSNVFLLNLAYWKLTKQLNDAIV